jgi:periplasmic divalent cation tolerance protein
MTDKIIVFSTCGSSEEAHRVARELVEARLAACVNIGGPVESVYRWKGAVESAQEWTLTIKSRRDLLPKLAAELTRAHSYEVPEVLALPVVDGSEAYLGWLEGELL